MSILSILSMDIGYLGVAIVTLPMERVSQKVMNESKKIWIVVGGSWLGLGLGLGLGFRTVTIVATICDHL